MGIYPPGGEIFGRQVSQTVLAAGQWELGLGGQPYAQPPPHVLSIALTIHLLTS